MPASYLSRYGVRCAALIGVLMMLVAAFAVPTVAQTVPSAPPISSKDPEAIAQLLRDRGQTVIVTVDEFNDPFIETSVNNIDYNIIFYGCADNQDCTSFSLRSQRASNGTSSFQAVNEWNVVQRWTKLYTADVNSAILEMDFLFTENPLSGPSFSAYLDLWDRSLVQFVRYIDEGEYDFVE